jgi:hypothetical protein
LKSSRGGYSPQALWPIAILSAIMVIGGLNNMATDSYDDILKRVRKELSTEERLRLIEELTNGSVLANDAEDGRSLFDALNARGKHMEGFGKHAD